MLTRIEIDGFKSFAGFELELSPFLAIVGPNASGKSNLFDAVQFLRRLSGEGLYDAFNNARGELGELFRRRPDREPVESMRFALEVLLEPRFLDQFGSEVEVQHSRLRYELTIQLREDSLGIVRPFVVDESVHRIRSGADRWAKAHASRAFRHAYLRYSSRTSPFLETVVERGRPVFKIAQEGKQGRRRELAAHAAEETVLSGITTAADFPSLYALRRELRSWRFLQLDPSALRLPSARPQRGDALDPNGANLARVLWEIERRSQYGRDGIDEIQRGLEQVIRGLSGIEVVEDSSRDQWETYITTHREGRISARVASDGTLRVLALLTALHEPAGGGLICFEEPENGIFPLRLRDLVRQLRGMVVSPSASGHDPARPLSELVVSSHSPVMLDAVPAGDLVIFDMSTRVDPSSRTTEQVTRARRVQDNAEPVPLDEGQLYATESEVRALTAIGRAEASELLD